MNRSPRSESAFTLIEMLTVMIIIAVITSLLVGVAGYVNKRGATERCRGEIAAMSSGCENYKADNGTYPRHDNDMSAFEGESGVTDQLDPRKDGKANGSKYKLASLYLYNELSGDYNHNGRPGDEGTTPPEPPKGYMEFRPDQIKFDDAKARNRKVLYLQDPFGNSYGYSTAGAKIEAEFQKKARLNSAEQRVSASALEGFSPTFDLWSTGGVITKDNDTTADQPKWIKNWN